MFLFTSTSGTEISFSSPCSFLCSGTRSDCMVANNPYEINTVVPEKKIENTENRFAAFLSFERKKPTATATSPTIPAKIIPGKVSAMAMAMRSGPSA